MKRFNFASALIIGIISNWGFALDYQAKPDIRLQMHNEKGHQLSPNEPSQRSYSLLRFRLEQIANFHQRLSAIANIDIIEGLSGAALTQTTYPGFSAMDSEGANLGTHSKNVELFSLNYAYLRWDNQTTAFRAGIMPYQFGYGMYYNDALHSHAHQSPLEMTTGKVGGIILTHRPLPGLAINGGFHTPPTGRGKSLEKVGEEKGIDQKKLLLHLDYQRSTYKTALFWTRGVGDSDVPYTPFEVGLFGQFRQDNLELGQEIWFTGGRWGSNNQTKGVGWFNKLAYRLHPSIQSGLETAYASGEKDQTATVSEQFRFHDDFSFSHLLFKQIVPKAASAKDTAGDFRIFRGIFTNALAVKPYIQFDLPAAESRTRLSYIYAQKIANTAGNETHKLGDELDLDVDYLLDENLRLNLFAAYLWTGKGLDIPKAGTAFKLGLGLNASL